TSQSSLANRSKISQKALTSTTPPLETNPQIETAPKPPHFSQRKPYLQRGGPVSSTRGTLTGRQFANSGKCSLAIAIRSQGTIGAAYFDSCLKKACGGHPG